MNFGHLKIKVGFKICNFAFLTPPPHKTNYINLQKLIRLTLPFTLSALTHSTRDSGAPHGGAAGILLTGWSVRFPMADDRRISGACTVHLARSGSLPMVQLAATLAPSDSATAQIYPWCRPPCNTPRGRGGVLTKVPPPWKFQNDSMWHYFFIFGQSSNWISSVRRRAGHPDL